MRLYGNPSAIFGKTAAELAGRSVADITEPAAAWSDRFARSLAGETLTLRERRNSTIWNISVFPIRLEGAVCYAGGLACEVTPWCKAEQELRYTALRALSAQELQRTMVSNFLHDVVGQNLTAFGLQLDLLHMDLETASIEHGARIAEMQKLLEEMMEAVREYSYELNPSTVERAGLRTALGRLADRIRERFTGALRLNMDRSLKLDKKIAAALYQIAQESVENAVQHAGCSAIEIAVKSSRTGTVLEVRDNGRGFDPAEPAGSSRGLGLLSMEHCAAEAGLDLSIASHHGRGTIVRAAEPGVV